MHNTHTYMHAYIMHMHTHIRTYVDQEENMDNPVQIITTVRCSYEYSWGFGFDLCSMRDFSKGLELSKHFTS